jgi:hypothetical protein
VNRWKWKHRETGEPMTLFRVEHHLTREDIADLLCVSSVETGTRMSQALVAHTVHLELRIATALEPIETWANSYSDEEADARLEWARAQAQRFYERTSK